MLIYAAVFLAWALLHYQAIETRNLCEDIRKHSNLIRPCEVENEIW